MATPKKGTPKRDGSGGGKRLNRGRGGCVPTRRTGRGRTGTPRGGGRNRR